MLTTIFYTAVSMDQLKLELKRWERDFEKGHGRVPSRNDIKRLPEMKNKYIQYALLRSKQKSTTNEKPQRTPNKTETLELGPTPQIYGKAIGIFDMKFSPLKPVSIISPAEASQVHLEASKEMQLVKRRLDFSLTPKSSPKKPNYGPNSPLKFDDVAIRIHTTPKKNNSDPNRAVLGRSNGSPSPIIKRPIGKPFSQLLKEHEQIMEEMETWSEEDVVARKIKDVFQADSDETEDELDAEQGLPKRAKRKHILRPAKQQPVQGIQPPADLHVEIARLKRKALGHQDESTENEPDNTNPKTVTLAPKKGGRKKKYNTVSNNFRRLKLPSAKRGGRWRRR